jgi:ubiquinone/menaquinone biosynthesis C-methylase UbiE
LPSIDKLKEYRKLALEQFVSDYPTGIKEKRYIKAELPKLPFKDKSFDLVLSGHFLFTYSHKFDFSFILSSILELYRVSSKVRIYHLQKSSLQPYEQMTELLFALEKLRIGYYIVPVPFEFQRGSNKMLLLRRMKAFIPITN